MNADTESILSFGFWIQRRRKSLNLTQEALARQIGCSKALIKKIEADERRPSYQIAALLAQALTIPTDDEALFILVARGEQSCARLPYPESHLYAIPQQTSITPKPTDTISERQDIAAARPMPTPFQAPALPSHFVGRSTELQRLHDYFLNPNQQAKVALVGMGGIGKSTLAASLAHDLRAHFPDGVLWMNINRSQPMDVLQSWAQSFGYDFSSISDLESRAAAVRGILANKRLLIVLDNVISAAAIRPLLPGGDSCAVLITTRMQDEAAALDARLFLLDGLAIQEGLQLLTRILGDERVTAAPEAANAICDQLQNYPLALEIVAKLLLRAGDGFLTGSLSAMAKRLQDEKRRLDQLKLGDLSVRAAFELSWQLLNAEQRRLFAQTGVFGGRSFSTAALAYISEQSLIDTEDRLFELIGLSLLSVEGHGRYHQHPLLADFARERLLNAPTTFARFSDYYLALVQQHPTDYALLEPEWDHLMVGMQAAHAAHRWQTTIDYANALTQPWAIRAGYTQARLGYAWAVEAARELEDQRMLPELLVDWGYVTSEQNDYAEAARYLNEAIGLARQLQLPAVVANAHFHLARIAIELSQHEDADEFLSECQRIWQILGDNQGTAAALQRRADLLIRTGSYPQAEELSKMALAARIEQGDFNRAIESLRLLVDIALQQNFPNRAEQLCHQELDMAREISNRSEEAIALYNMAVIHRRQKKYQTALEFAQQARSTFYQMGMRNYLAYTLNEVSKLQKVLKNDKAALEAAEQGLTLVRELKDEYGEVVCLYDIGELYLHIGREEYGRQMFVEGKVLAQRIRFPHIHLFDERLATLES